MSHASWRVALAECQRQVQAQIAARAAPQDESALFTLSWCYLSNYYAPASEAILDELHRALPGVAWVGTVGVGVAASGTHETSGTHEDSWLYLYRAVEWTVVWAGYR